jgi:hypothetical protein
VPTAQERTPKKRKIQEVQEAASSRARANGDTPLDEQACALIEDGKADELQPAHQAKAYLKLHACACSGTKAELIQRCKKFKDLHGHASPPRPTRTIKMPSCPSRCTGRRVCDSSAPWRCSSKVKTHNIWRKDRYNDWPLPKRFVV